MWSTSHPKTWHVFGKDIFEANHTSLDCGTANCVKLKNFRTESLHSFLFKSQNHIKSIKDSQNPPGIAAKSLYSLVKYISDRTIPYSFFVISCMKIEYFHGVQTSGISLSTFRLWESEGKSGWANTKDGGGTDWKNSKGYSSLFIKPSEDPS